MARNTNWPEVYEQFQANLDTLAATLPEIGERRPDIQQGAQNMISQIGSQIKPEIFTNPDLALITGALALRAYEHPAGGQHPDGYPKAYDPKTLVTNGAILLGAVPPDAVEETIKYAPFVNDAMSQQLLESAIGLDLFEVARRDLGIIANPRRERLCVLHVLDVNAQDGYKSEFTTNTTNLKTAFDWDYVPQAWVSTTNDGIAHMYIPWHLASKVVRAGCLGDIDYETRKAFNHEFRHSQMDVKAGSLLAAGNEILASGRFDWDVVRAACEFAHRSLPFLNGYNLGEDLVNLKPGSDMPKFHQRMVRRLGLQLFLEFALMPAYGDNDLSPRRRELHKQLGGFNQISERILQAATPDQMAQIVDRMEMFGTATLLAREDGWLEQARRAAPVRAQVPAQPKTTPQAVAAENSSSIGEVTTALDQIYNLLVDGPTLPEITAYLERSLEDIRIQLDGTTNPNAQAVLDSLTQALKTIRWGLCARYEARSAITRYQKRV